jgi:predicted small secreted protein
MRRMWTQLMTAAVIATALLATGCNTARGFGEDLSQLGNKITGSAEKHTDKQQQ